MRRKAKILPPELSMVNPAMDRLVKKTRSRYVLVMLAAKRARSLLEGTECLAKYQDSKFVTNALEEIAEKRIKAKVPEDDAYIDSPKLKAGGSLNVDKAANSSSEVKIISPDSETSEAGVFTPLDPDVDLTTNDPVAVEAAVEVAEESASEPSKGE